MVAGLSRKKKSQAAYVDDLSAAIAELRKTGDELAAAIDRDAASYESVLAAYKLSKETPAEQEKREATIQEAMKSASEVPMRVAELAAEIYERLGQLEGISAASMLSDLRVGRLMAAAGARGALANVAINLESITDKTFSARMQRRAADAEARLTSGARAASSAVKS
jgi:glutamate formiminotransferase/formiminotetrahydrofolate cyclodeaminase